MNSPFIRSTRSFIPIKPNGDAFLRNPERNAGRYVGIQHATVDGSTIKFLGADKTVIAQSPFDGDSFSIPIRGATLDFHRANAAEEERLSGMTAKADEAGFLVVYPEGSGRPQNWRVGPGRRWTPAPRRLCRRPRWR